MIAAPGEWRKLRAMLVWLLIFSFAIYLPCLFLDFFADDDIYLAFAFRVVGNYAWYEIPFSLLSPANPWEYLPLRDLTYWFDFKLFGDNAFGYLASNLVWYLASAASAGWLVRELVVSCRPAWAGRATELVLCGVVFFMIHPAHLETVAWIASRKDLMAGALGLLSSAFTLCAIRHGWSLREMLLAAACLFFACFSKAAAMTTVIFMTTAIFTFWRFYGECIQLRKFIFLALIWIIIAIAFVIHYRVGQATGIRIENHPGFFVMLERGSRILTALAGILVLPYRLGLYYDVYQIGAWHWLISTGLLFLFAIALLVLVRRCEIWAFGVVLALSPLPIYLQFIPFSTWSLASERFVFVSVAGLALVLVDVCGRLNKPEWVRIFVLGLFVPCAIALWSRLPDWESDSSLFLREYERHPAFHNAAKNYIIYVLFPKHRYTEATGVARQVERADARELLLALTLTDIAQEQAKGRVGGSAVISNLVESGFCTSVATLERLVAEGETQIPGAADVSYNNFLLTLRRELHFSYSALRVSCGQVRQLVVTDVSNRQSGK
jgi:hypothetical protein